MNRVTVNAEEVSLPKWSDSLCCFALKVLDEIKRENWELSILLCGDKTIATLNSQYRNKSEPTDILSFNLGDTVTEDGKTVYLPGDLVISLDTLRENAKYFAVNEDEELRRLLIHGILHLDGMDHETTDKEEPMLAFQEEILDRLKDEHILGAEGKT
ncbi:rRNA maturation RNase YbeY [Treponema sp. R6D11]